MKKTKMYYPGREEMKVLREILDEVDKILKYPTLIFTRSRFKGIDIENDNVSFLHLYKPDYSPFDLPPIVTGPFLPFQGVVLTLLEEKKIREEKKRIHKRLNGQIIQVNEMLNSVQGIDRKETLELTLKVMHRVEKEVKEDLMR